jgi:CTP:molybdopterin cytidylyltransferase MocA
LREVLRQADTLLLQAPENNELDNINTPLDWQRIDLRTRQGRSE